MSWRTTTGFTDLAPLPFDYRKELVGGRTPCLEGSANLRTAAGAMGWGYDLMSNQSKTPNGAAAKRPQWQQDATNTFLAGFTRAYEGNRAPLVIRNHFEDWNGGIYLKAVEDAMRKMATYPDTRFVSFRQLCDFLDAQPPATLAKLRTLPIGAAPAKGWGRYLTAEG